MYFDTYASRFGLKTQKSCGQLDQHSVQFEDFHKLQKNKAQT